MVPTDSALAAQRIVDFEHPPVAETALGVVFAPISKWSVLHFGLLWEKFRKLYPVTEIRPATGGQVEFRISSATESVDFPIRALFVDQSGNQLLQVQRNAFIRNWRQTEETTQYEHYENVRPLFERDWAIFCEFLDQEQLGEVEVVQCEVTYINHLVRAREWENFEDVSKVFRVWSGGSLGSLKASQMVSFTTAYDLPSNPGRLQVVVQPGIRKTDSKEIIQFALTATVKPTSSTLAEILKSLDAGHVAVVTSFRDFTTPAMHSYWGIK
jgi:uncharacterized protein (TIGR04255 family)